MSYKIPTESLNVSSSQEALTHPLYKIIPRHRSQIYWYDLPHWTSWMLFGNDDDGIFGEGDKDNYNPERKALRWWLRNPLHNFCFYVIGSAYRQNGQFTLVDLRSQRNRFFKYQPTEGRDFEKKETRFFLGFHGGKPFIYLKLLWGNRHQSLFYIGWRERGNFGIRFTPNVTQKS